MPIMLQGDRTAARRVLTEAIALSQASGNIFTTILATIGLGQIQEAENQLHLAAETYRHVLQMAGDQPVRLSAKPIWACRIFSTNGTIWIRAEQHVQQSLNSRSSMIAVIDRFIVCEVFLARLKLAQGDVAAAASLLAQADQSVRQNNFVYRIPEVAAAQVRCCCVRAIWRQPRIWLRPTNSRSARRGYISLRETHPQRWRCWNPCASRQRQRVGQMNDSR